MSPWVIVTAYFARSCWISTMSSVLVDIHPASFHYKTYVLCNAYVQKRISWHGDDIGKAALGQPAEIRFVDQVGGYQSRRAQDRGRGHAPVDKGDELVRVLAVRDGGRICADGDLHARLVGGLDRRPRLGEHLRRLVLQLLRRSGDVHRLGQPPGGHQEPVVVDEHLDGLVVHEESVFDAVDTDRNRVLDSFGTMGVRRDAQPAPVCLVDDRGQLLVRIVLCPCLSGQRHDTAGAAYLDQLGAMLDLVAHGFADLVDTVGDALLDRQL